MNWSRHVCELGEAVDPHTLLRTHGCGKWMDRYHFHFLLSALIHCKTVLLFFFSLHYWEVINLDWPVTWPSILILKYYLFPYQYLNTDWFEKYADDWKGKLMCSHHCCSLIKCLLLFMVFCNNCFCFKLFWHNSSINLYKSTCTSLATFIITEHVTVKKIQSSVFLKCFNKS